MGIVTNREGHCVNCRGTGKVTEPWSTPADCPVCVGGRTLRGRYACCSKALELTPRCVCSFVSWCPDHGEQCNGSHD